MVLLNVVMIAYAAGVATIYSRHAEVLDEPTVDACVEQAALEDSRLTSGTDYDREVDFDGQDILRVRVARDGRADLVIRCGYSLPDDDSLPPTIEDAWVTKE